ncbi:MAG TPA: DUF1223 domain-containing protein [Verrucomicrobiae bacterium]|nr:DUF1223 domain-containing protein [Verrucomicrobiae bacterium]
MSAWGSARIGACALAFFALLCLPATPADSAPPQSAPLSTAAAGPHPVLIELFTSEGCSSCPPADILLEKLDVHQPIAGAQLIVLSEHVDYWDHDGWKDPNSSALLTERQSDYERELGRDSPYTPQMIIDGTTEPQMNQPLLLEQVLVKARDVPMIPMRIADVTIESATLRAHIEAGANFDKHNADVYVAVALDRVESQVLRGENGGKHLTHVAVVEELRKIGRLPQGKSFAGDVALKLKPGTDPKNIRVVAFVQEPGPGKVLGSVERKPTS